MVKFNDERKTLFFPFRIVNAKPVYKGDVPQRAVPLEGFLHNPGCQRHQACLLSMFAQINVGEMPLNTEAWVVNPVGAPKAQGDFLELLPEQWHYVQAATQIRNKRAERQGIAQAAGVEQVDTANVHGGGF